MVFIILRYNFLYLDKSNYIIDLVTQFYRVKFSKFKKAYGVAEINIFY